MARSKSRKKQKKKENSQDAEPISPNLYYTTLPQSQNPWPMMSPYATGPMIGLSMPNYLNQTAAMSPGYYNMPPPALSYNAGDPYGRPGYGGPAYNNEIEAAREEKVKEFEIFFKGGLLFISLNLLVGVAESVPGAVG